MAIIISGDDGPDVVISDPGGPAGSGSVVTADTATLDLSGDGTAGNPLKGDVTATGTGAPSGPAGGPDLEGTYPNPVLTPTGVTAGTYGDATHVPVLTLDAKGRITVIATVLISATGGGGGAPTGPAGGDLAGSYPDPVLKTSGVTAGAYGDATHIPILTLDAKGRVTVASTVAIPAYPTTLPPNGAAGGDLAGTYPNPTLGVTGVGAGVYGDSTHYGAFQVDVKGRLVAASQFSLPSIPTALPPNGAAGGDLAGTYPSPTLGLVGTAGTYGTATQVPQFTVDAKGRITGVTLVTITHPLAGFPLLAPDGTLAAPSYAFANDTDTGMFLSAVGDVRLVAAGSPRLWVTDDGTNGSVFLNARGTGALALQFGGSNRITVQNAAILLATFARGVNGSITQPTWSFSNDTDSGLYLGSVSGDVRLAVGGQDRIIATDDGTNGSVALNARGTGGVTANAQVTAPSIQATGKTGATATPITLAGGTTAGAPTTGAHVKGEIAFSDVGVGYYCTVAGTPGTWVAINATPSLLQGSNIVLTPGVGTLTVAVDPLFAARSVDQSIVAAAAQTQTSNATVIDDAELLLPVAANAVYEVTVHLFYDGDSAADFRIGWAGPAGATLNWGVTGGINTATTGGAQAVDLNARIITGTGIIGGYGIGTLLRAHVHGILQTSTASGTLNFRWAQGTSSATVLTRAAGSALVLKRLA